MAVFASQGCGGAASSLFGGLNTPVITGITNPVKRPSTVTITGLDLNGSLTTVYYANVNTGGVVATITASSGSTTSVVASVPTTAGNYSVYVTTSDGNGNVSSASNTVSLTVN